MLAAFSKPETWARLQQLLAYMTDEIPDVGAAALSAEFEEDDPDDDDPGRDPADLNARS